MNIFALNACLAIFASIAVPAFGQEATPDVRISVRDLDLSTAEGVLALDRRIATAVKSVCPDQWAGDLGAKMAARRCNQVKLAEVAPKRRMLLARANSRSRNLMAAR